MPSAPEPTTDGENRSSEGPDTTLKHRTPVVKGPTETRFTLMLLEGVASGRTWTIKSGLRVGRDTSCDVTVIDKSVSRRHARFHQLPDGKWLLEDLHSSNGSFINDHVITTQIVHPGDHIRLGEGTTFRFSRADRLEAKWADTQRLESVGRLTGGLAHDYNNLMMVIAANANLLRQSLAEPGVLDRAQANALVDDICSASAKASRITQQLLEFTRGGADVLTVFDLRQVCTDALRLARIVVSPKVEMRMEATRPVLIEADEGRISQVILNLCVNAGDAMPSGGTLTLGLTHVHTEHDGGSWAMLEVSDTGVGMPPEVQRQIFEPFYTTKPKGSGTGLGLAMCYGIVRSHGGSITVDSVEHQGTRFTVRLPAREKLQLGAAVAQTQAKTLDLQGLVLIVDDNALVRRASSRLLKSVGLRTLQAASCDEAMALCHARSPDIQLVLLDLSMPGISGMETLAQLRSFDTQTPVIICTGAAETTLQSVLDAGAQGLLIKPYDAFALAQALDLAGIGGPET